MPVVKVTFGFVADVHSDDLEPIFTLIAKTGDKNTKESTFINITQNSLMMCDSPFSKKLGEKFVHKYLETNTDILTIQIQNRFRIEKKVAILKASNKTVVLTHGEDIALAEEKIRRNIIEKRTQLRRIDCKALVKVLEHLHTRCETAHQSLKSDDRVALRTASYSDTDIKPRHKDKTLQKTSVCPYYDVIFKNPLMPIEDQGDEYLTEAKDDAMDHHSMPRGTNRQTVFDEGASFGFAQHIRYDFYASSEKRRSTFQTTEWKVSEKPDIDSLVGQGFFFTGREDLVRCFMCAIGLNDWVKNDDVVKEHAKHSSKCAHLLQTIGKTEVDRIQAELSPDESSSLLSGNQLPYKIRSPQYQRMDARLAFPSRIHILHRELAVAGLFFTDRFTVTDIQPRHKVRGDKVESVLPHHKGAYNKPEYTRLGEEETVEVIEEEEVQYPIQASDDVMDCMSSMQIAPTGQSMFGSQGEGSSQFRSSFLSGFAAPPLFNSRRSQNSSIDSTSFNSSIPRYDMYASSDRRRSTFQKPEWKVYEKPDISVLVDQGFFFTSKEDLVRCFMCGIGLKDWVRGDDVVKEHAKHSSKCAYLLQKNGKVEVDRIQAEISSNESSSSLSWNQLPYKIRSPQYQRMDARLATFSSFPSRIHIPHQELAVAGLFFTGKVDLCRCFTCDGGLKNWSDGDDPCKEHATYFSHCEYINQLKGRDYIRDMQQRRRQKRQLTGGTIGEPGLEQYSSALFDISSPAGSGLVFSQLKDMGYSDSDVMIAFKELKKKGVLNLTADKLVNTILDMHEQRQAEGATATANWTTDPKDDSNTIKEENKRLAQVIQCMLCLDEEPDVLFLPCTHHIICHMCSQKIKYCPVCKAQIMESIRTYRV